MKLIINTSNLYIGGGVQVALSFINELKEIKNDHEYHLFLSNIISKYIDQKSFSNKFHFYLIESSPSSLKTRRQIVLQLDTLEKQIKPDIVFSIFGPTYWRPRTKHLLGFADGWVYNPKSITYDRLSSLKRFKMRLHGKYKSYYLKRDADYYVLETNDAKRKLAKMADLDRDNIFVVGNTHSSIFNDDKYINEDNTFYIKLPDKIENEFRLIYITSYKPNKNLEIIMKLIPFLDEYNIKFILTLDEKIFKKLFPNSTEKIINIGPISHNSCPSVYKQCDALFAPTLLETFSASYPEAMKIGKPILTSNYSFATDVCGNAALYFDPLDPKDIAEKIKKLIENKALKNELIEKGKEQLKQFETARSRAEKYIALCEKIVKH